MTTELTPSSAPTVAIKGDEIEVSAATPSEMAQSQSALIAWCERKIALVRAEAKELRESYKIAVERKWKSATLLKHANLGEKRVTFYEKMKAALEAGYIIVPNFPISLFAIRTDKNNPVRMRHYGTYRLSDAYYESQAPGLPPGEGEHQNPDPKVLCSSAPTEEKKDRKEFWAGYFDHIEFPVSMAKPNIMEAATRAMALKLFDDFGILPAASRYTDPMIVARLLDPRSTRHNRRYVSFIVAWHLDTSTL